MTSVTVVVIICYISLLLQKLLYDGKNSYHDICGGNYQLQLLCYPHLPPTRGLLALPPACSSTTTGFG